jgi:hypothetical protein
MTALELDAIRRDAPACTGIAWLAGAPLAVVAASGDPTGAAWVSWDAVARAALALVREGPVASPEVLVRGPAALLVLTDRPDGVIAVVIAASLASTGVAMVQARMATAAAVARLAPPAEPA